MDTPKTFTVFSCHFGDEFWVRNLIKSINHFGKGRVNDVVIINQNRDRPGEVLMLESIPGVTSVLEIPPSADQLRELGYDHGHALDSAIGLTEVVTSHIVVIDSDCFPVDVTWLDFDGDGMVAEVPGQPELSHPCFMVFPSKAKTVVNFSDGLLVSETYPKTFDTGRQVGKQLRENGYDIESLSAIQGFGGRRGFFYKQGAVYHHKHGSLSSHTYSLNEAIYRRKIATRDFRLSWLDVVALGFGVAVGRLLGSRGSK